MAPTVQVCVSVMDMVHVTMSRAANVMPGGRETTATRMSMSVT